MCTKITGSDDDTKGGLNHRDEDQNKLIRVSQMSKVGELDAVSSEEKENEAGSDLLQLCMKRTIDHLMM